MSQKPSKIREFRKRFPDEDSCLTHLMRSRFGERFTCFSCQKEATYYRVTARRSYRHASIAAIRSIRPPARPSTATRTTPARLVLCHVPVLRDAERASLQRKCRAPARRDLQDRVAHVPHDPALYGLCRW